MSPTVFPSADRLRAGLAGILEFSDGRVTSVVDAAGLRAGAIDDLIYTAVFADDPALCRSAGAVIREAATLLGARAASIQALYDAMGRGEASGFTVPALNLRLLPYDSARAAFRAAKQLDVGPVIFEIARSEMGYTNQDPAEYAANILAAAAKEGWEGPVFIQGDHFQINASRYAHDPDREIEGLNALSAEAIQAQFLNIDIDSSTLVDLTQPNTTEQQRPNFEVAAAAIRHIRSREPSAVRVSVGVEIGEVGGKNSTPEELRAFMDGLHGQLGDVPGPSKISVQTGSSHGGVVLPDGSIAKVAIAFETLEEMSRVARAEYGMAGAVQHGASTLPDELFHRFPQVGTAEIHLATAFQNQILDSTLFPDTLGDEIAIYLKDKHAGEWKTGQTEAQFIYSNRKRAGGPFKRRIWDLPEDVKGALRDDLEQRFAFLFRQLAVPNTRELTLRYVRP